MYAVIQTGGKQYKVQEGDVLFVEKLDVQEGEQITFNEVLAVNSNDGLKTGSPFVSGAFVEATVLKNAKSKKIVVFRYKPKKNSKRKMGHRQPYTKVQISKVSV